jgi:hypothetical protein
LSTFGGTLTGSSGAWNAGIALGRFLAESTDTQQDPPRVSTLRALSHDSFSRGRYRAMEAIRNLATLIAQLKDSLAQLAKSDPVRPVRGLAQRALQDLRE